MKEHIKDLAIGFRLVLPFVCFLIGILLSDVSLAKDVQPVDGDCQKMAQNAKSFATLRATGLAQTPEQFQSFVVTPVVQTYPIKAILQYVFGQTDKSPDDIYTALYGRCTLMGYKELYSYFQDREEAYKLRIRISDQEQQIATLTQQVNVLEVENTNLKAPPVLPVKHHVTIPTAVVELPNGCTKNGAPCQK